MVCGEVKAPIPLVVRRIAKKDAQGRSWSELVRSGGGEVGVTGAAESPEVMIGRMSAIEREERGAHL